MIFILLASYLSVLLPDPALRSENWIDENKIILPYGFSPKFCKKSGVNLSSYSVIDTVNYTQFSPTFSYIFGEWGGVVSPYIRYGGDYFYPERKKFNVYSDIIRGSIFYKNDNILFSFGKDIFSVGPAVKDNFLLSPNIPLNYVSFTWKNDFLSLTHFISRLDNYTGVEREWDDTTSGYLTEVNRYLGIHRLELRPADWLAFSFSEAMLIGGESLGFPFELLNPLTIYYVEQYNQKENVNILWNFDVAAVREKFYFYLGLFIDDFQYEEDPWKEPNHIGIYAGLQGKDIFVDKSEVLFSYNLATRWSYNNLRVWQRYTDKGLPLGSSHGCDYDRLVAKFLYPLSVFKIGALISHTRRGENRIETPWPVNAAIGISPENEFKGTNFLYGIVEKRLSIATILKYRNFGELNVGMSFFKNYKNDKGRTKTLPLLRLKLNYKL